MAVTVKALFGKKAPAKKAPAKGTRKVVKKAAPAKKSGGGGGRGSWGGSGSATYNLGKWYGADRSLFLPSGLLDPTDIPSWLNGELAGDYGYDPLELGKSGDVAKYREEELIHA